MIKSPLRYPGGKSRAVEQIMPLLPAFQEFREPFVGGGSIFLHTKQLYPNRQYWINDLYFELYNFWKYTQIDVAAVISQVQKWQNAFTEGKQLHKFLGENIASMTETEKAGAFFVFNRITFSGTTEAGGYSEQAYLHRFTPSSIERLLKMAPLLNGVTITHQDYQEVVEKPGKEVFLFLDPPYYSATKSALYGKRGKLHTHFDHLRFAETMRNCPHKWLITYDNSQYIKDLFSFANIYEFQVMYGMKNQTETSSQVGKEIFIANYPLDHKLLDKTPRAYAQPAADWRLFEPKNAYSPDAP